MAFTRDEFCALRPFLYHLSAAENIGRIMRMRQLLPTTDLLREAGQPHLTRVRRRENMRVTIGRDTVLIRDQGPLHVGNLQLEAGWTVEDLLEEINARVFFWPGTADGPIDYGIRHFERNKHDAVIVRVASADLFARHPRIEFAKYNTGSPRCVGGKKSPRGPSTYLPETKCHFKRGEAVEVAIKGTVNLPSKVWQATTYNGPWNPW